MKNHKRALITAIILAWLPLAISAAYPQVYKWSLTASSNTSADPSINWREGQSPSSVNDSARAMMAALAGYRDDISGSLATTGTASAYLVATNQGLPSTPNDGQLLAVTVNVTNGISPTLSADGGGAYPIQSAAGAAVSAGTLIAGSPYSLKFSVSNNAWILRDFYGSALTVPLGAMMPYTGSSVPNSNFVFPAGQCLSTTTYAAYWVFLGTPGSSGCSGGQFKIINMSGVVPAGLDTMPGFSAANKLTSSATGCGTAMTSVGAVCANGIEGSVIPLAQLPTGIASATSGVVTVTANTSNKNFPTTAGTLGGVQTLGGSQQASPATTAGGIGDYQTASSMSTAGTVSVTSNNTSGTARPNVPPTIGVTYLLRVI